MENDFLHGLIVIGKGVTILNWKKGGLDYILGGNSLLSWWLDNRTGCPEKLWMSQFLEVLKVKLDGAMGSLTYWSATLPMTGGLEVDELLGPFQLKPFCDSICIYYINSTQII